jgi:hypothetical protein
LSGHQVQIWQGARLRVGPEVWQETCLEGIGGFEILDVRFGVLGAEFGLLGARCGSGFRFQPPGADQVVGAGPVVEGGVSSSSIARQFHPVTQS